MDKYKELEKLKELLDKESISKEEFERRKKPYLTPKEESQKEEVKKPYFSKFNPHQEEEASYISISPPASEKQIEELVKLKELLDKKVLSEEEFIIEKKKILKPPRF